MVVKVFLSIPDMTREKVMISQLSFFFVNSRFPKIEHLFVAVAMDGLEG